MQKCGKGEDIPLGHEGPKGCEMSRLPHFLDNWLTDGDPPPLPGRLLVLISVTG
jgi:hypothetical protein